MRCPPLTSPFLALPLELLRSARRTWWRYRTRRNLLGNVCRNDHYVFIHVPKTAGTSIAAALGKSHCSHGTTREYRELLGPEFEELFSFAFVRHPGDRFMSLYRYARMQRSHHHSARHPWFARYGRHPDYALLRDATPSDAAHLLAEGKLSFQWLPQHHWVCDEAGRLDLSYCGRFESFDQGVAAIRSHIPLPDSIPTINESEGRERDYAAHLDVAARRILVEYYAKDFTLFGYPLPEA